MTATAFEMVLALNARSRRLRIANIAPLKAAP